MGQFWRDRPSQHDADSLRAARSLSLWRSTMLAYLGIVGIAIPAVIFWVLSKPLLYGWLSICLFFGMNVLRLARRTRAEQSAIAATQENAYRQTGASLMGSANHVAGHPRLNRDQRVLLAVGGDSLRIHSFASQDPLDQIPGTAIRKVELVVYDDERVAHTDAIDPAAQAIQVTFDRGSSTCKCLFNRMVDHRPIDWFHEIEKVRSSSSQ